MKKEKQVVKVSVPELVEVLKTVKLNQFINLVTLTIPTMNKTGNPFYNTETKQFTVRKLSSVNYRTSNYQNRVNSNMEKENLESDFVSLKPSGKTHVENTDCLLVSDKDPNVFYFMVERFDEVKPTVEYFNNGVPMNQLDIEILKGWLPERSDSSRQEQDKKVMVITPLVSNIKKLSTESMVYEVE
jgi:hypothetical protein